METIEELKEDLRAEGIDPDQFLTNVKDTINRFMPQGDYKSCPFCGGAGESVHQHWASRDFFGVQCQGECGTFFDCRAKSMEEARQQWNQRV